MAEMKVSIGHPSCIRSNNGPELTSKRLEQWAYLNEAGLDFRGPGKPTDNAFIGGVNGRLRQGSLNENGFLSLEDPEEKVG